MNTDDDQHLKDLLETLEESLGDYPEHDGMSEFDAALVREVVTLSQKLLSGIWNCAYCGLSLTHNHEKTDKHIHTCPSRPESQLLDALTEFIPVAVQYLSRLAKQQ